MMPLPEDWRVGTELLNSNAVEYVVVGPIALAHHGFPRYTGDLDRNTPENGPRLEGVLGQFGFGALGLKTRDFTDSYRVIQLGVPPSRIDLLTSITGMSFDDAWASREEVSLEGVKLNIIGRHSQTREQRRVPGT
jgi:hypothetical protein